MPLESNNSIEFEIECLNDSVFSQTISEISLFVVVLEFISNLSYKVLGFSFLLP